MSELKNCLVCQNDKELSEFPTKSYLDYRGNVILRDECLDCAKLNLKRCLQCHKIVSYENCTYSLVSVDGGHDVKEYCNLCTKCFNPIKWEKKVQPKKKIITKTYLF